ncbi:MAG: hypothetical protein H0W02_09570, partial [Ktedonobacteraceae bacterium]|nr:hypothetical protein [Ktedonobacteraceae bacterium]
MSFTIRRQENKEAARQSRGARAEQPKSQRPLSMRSPALESAERERAAREQIEHAGNGSRRRNPVSARTVRYAAQETL